MKGVKWNLRILAFVLLLSFHSWAQTLSIYHFDVGQGDATLIVASSGRTLFVGGGGTGKRIDRVAPLLQLLNIQSLDDVVAGHYDAGHIGSIDEVVTALGGRINRQAFNRGDAKLGNRTT